MSQDSFQNECCYESMTAVRVQICRGSAVAAMGPGRPTDCADYSVKADGALSLPQLSRW